MSKVPLTWETGQFQVDPKDRLTIVAPLNCLVLHWHEMSLFDFVSLARFLKRVAFGRRQLVAQPVPVVTPNDVERVVRRDFSNGQFDAVMALLNDCRIGSGESARVQLAALKLTEGSREKLRAYLESAKLDYRDVLVAAEYPDYSKMGFKVREMPSEDQRRIVDSDRAQYERWLRK